MAYKFLEHTADVKFVAEGKTKEEMFTECSKALKETMTKGIIIKPLIQKEIHVHGTDDESLLYNFLEEFLYLFDAESFVLSEVKEIKVIENEVVAIVMGDAVSSYKISNDVKAITYNDMYVRQIDNVWECQVVLDV